MNYWVFIATEHKSENGSIPARKIYEMRMGDKFWGLGERTPNRKQLRKGDIVVFYVGLPEMVFAGSATLASNAFELSEEQSKRFGHENDFFYSKYGVELENTETWIDAPSAKDLSQHMSFIENKQYWGSYFQGGVRQLPKIDFDLILSGKNTSLIEEIASLPDLESQSEFALEAHLEEFLFSNWDNVDWGANLKLYSTEESDGRQYPASQWSIDFLAIDQDTNEFVIIELKRGKSSDAVVGQILRYMAYVNEELAYENQGVKGLIIAREVDDALRYSIKSTQNIEVKTYKVDFRLQSL